MLTGIGLISACTGSMVQPEPSAQTSVQPCYWTAALQARTEQLLAAGDEPVARGNVELYKAAMVRELAALAGDEGRIDVCQDVILLRLPGEWTFEVGSAELSAQTTMRMEALARVLVNYRLSVVEISGHTDNSGSAESNRRLSVLRAQAVADFFQSRGVNPLRMVVVGRSDTQPVADNANPEGRRMNRRVEIRVLPLVVHEQQAGAESGRE